MKRLFRVPSLRVPVTEPINSCRPEKMRQSSSKASCAVRANRLLPLSLFLKERSTWLQRRATAESPSLSVSDRELEPNETFSAVMDTTSLEKDQKEKKEKKKGKEKKKSKQTQPQNKDSSEQY